MDMRRKKWLAEVSVREQAEFLIKEMNLDQEHLELTEDELIAEVIEYIVCQKLALQALRQSPKRGLAVNSWVDRKGRRSRRSREQHATTH